MNTIENNKLIAEFMGLDVLYNNSVHHDSAEIGKVTLMKYSTSWDWLIPVIQEIKRNYKRIPEFWQDWDDIFNEQLPKLNIDILYSIVIDFINWYNKQIKNETLNTQP